MTRTYESRIIAKILVLGGLAISSCLIDEPQIDDRIQDAEERVTIEQSTADVARAPGRRPALQQGSELRSTPRAAHADTRGRGEVAGAFASFFGELTLPNQELRIGFDVDSPAITLGQDGDVGLVLVLDTPVGSDFDPGRIDIEPPPNVGGAQKPDTKGSNASLTLASLVSGEYEAVIRGEHGTTGPYRLDIFLAGDANGDLVVDDTDVDLIAGLSGVRYGDAAYSNLADVDRNGVINGGDRQRARANLGAAAQLVGGVDPLDEFLPAGALQLEGLSEHGFNSRTGPLRFSLAGSEFERELVDVALTVNGSLIAADAIVVEPNLLSAAVTLANGRNDISLKTYDVTGRPLFFTGTVWAGDHTLQVRLVHPDGTPFLASTTVSATLSDDHEVTESQTNVVGGVATFTHLPARTILFKGVGEGNELGTAGALGNAGTTTIVMYGFGQPSDVDNNDFSQGLDGWETGSAPVSIIPHVEDIPGFPTAAGASNDASPIASRGLVDNDLRLSTSGEGEQTISRTFTSDSGASGVRIRYRFVTTEVPGGYFGSQYNDYFRVSVRSQLGGGSESEHNSMNALGLGAFDFASGSTDWREIVLPLDRDGDTIQVDVAVANVADGILDSHVVVDFVEELYDVVMPALAWNNTQGGLDLTYTVEHEPNEDVDIEVFWASGSDYSSRIGAALFTHTVAVGTAPGTYGPVRIEGGDLEDDPAGVTHLIAASSETEVGAIADVVVGFGANADAAAVSTDMLDIVGDGLRAAGQTPGTITSTARTPADQARAMFQNLVNPARTIAQNIAVQRGIYAAAGDAVITVFENQVAGLTRPQVIAAAAAIQAAMVAEINAQGPSNVSRHCADSTVISVVDVTAAPFNAQNAPLFEASVTGRVDRLIDERNTNNCYHLELAVTP